MISSFTQAVIRLDAHAPCDPGGNLSLRTVYIILCPLGLVHFMLVDKLGTGSLPVRNSGSDRERFW